MAFEGGGGGIVYLDPVLENIKFIGTRKFANALNRAAKAEVAAIIREISPVYANWKPYDRPDWFVETARDYKQLTLPTGVFENRIGEGVVALVSTDSVPFVYLERGTKRRHRAMSTGWRSKTRPRWLGSGAGQGYASIFVKQPLKGIKAREWLDVVAERRMSAGEFSSTVNKLFNVASRGAWTGGKKA